MSAIKKPVNIVDVTYARTGGSVNTDAMGMREMQQRVFAKRDAQHLLIKAPPASGKSRALMFVALDKLYNQGRKKVIVAVPERSIGASFSSTEAHRSTASSPTGRSSPSTTSATPAPRRARSARSSTS